MPGPLPSDSEGGGIGGVESGIASTVERVASSCHAASAARRSRQRCFGGASVGRPAYWGRDRLPAARQDGGARWRAARGLRGASRFGWAL